KFAIKGGSTVEYNEEQEKSISRVNLLIVSVKKHRSFAGTSVTVPELPRLGLLPVISADALPAYRC
ncbi:MAG: hypothetical protein ACLRRT_15055, partial [Ruthenibacterium lactatiformans]